MGEPRGLIDREAVEAIQEALDRAEPGIRVSYGLIGAIMLFGGVGWLIDRSLQVGPWGLLCGLVAGLCVGLNGLARLMRLRRWRQ